MSALNADDVSGIPYVVLILDPLLIVIAGLTKTVNIVLPVTPKESVAVIVS